MLSSKAGALGTGILGSADSGFEVDCRDFLMRLGLLVDWTFAGATFLVGEDEALFAFCRGFDEGTGSGVLCEYADVPEPDWTCGRSMDEAGSLG